MFLQTVCSIRIPIINCSFNTAFSRCVRKAIVSKCRFLLAACLIDLQWAALLPAILQLFAISSSVTDEPIARCTSPDGCSPSYLIERGIP